MANDRINVSSEAFEEAISQFNGCMSELQNAYLQMTNTVFQLDGSWNGEASEKFKKKFRDLAARLSTSDGTIDKAIKDIQMVIAGHTDTTEEVSAMFSAASDTTDPFSAG